MPVAALKVSTAVWISARAPAGALVRLARQCSVLHGFQRTSEPSVLRLTAKPVDAAETAGDDAAAVATAVDLVEDAGWAVVVVGLVAGAAAGGLAARAV